MPRAMFIAFLVLTASALALGGCAGSGNDRGADLAPELLEMEIIPNPANLNDEATFIASFRDLDGDMKNATVQLKLYPGGLDTEEDEDDQESIVLPVVDLQIMGDTAGTISFVVEIVDDYDGTTQLTVTDEAGRTSETVEEYLFVNLVHTD